MKSIRQQFGRKISYSGWFDIAFSSMQNKEWIAAFAPGCIHKSGKKVILPLTPYFPLHDSR
ncbi:hypothetical protein BW716_34440 [[Flexibacter] sp. ATCC 35208]|nr:hypothetical protein BW716_34440 [[Flexibacter] sp. ATCC 35208]